MEPNTKEWNNFRRGKFTASECSNLMGSKGGITTKTAKTYIMSRVAEHLSDPDWFDDSYKGKEIEWGNLHEPDALEYYSLAFNVNVDKPDPQNADFSSEVSCSPDGIAYPIDAKPYGLEIKSPFNRCNHIKHMLMKVEADLKDANSDYYWQVLCCMLIFNFDYYEFISYDPRFIGSNRMYVLPFYRNNVESDIALLKQNLILAVEEKHRIIDLINN